MINTKAVRNSTRTIPYGPRGYPLVGILPQVMNNPLEALTNAARQYGVVVCLGSYLPGRKVILISRLEPALSLNPRHYCSRVMAFL
jgi:hypothetical protein